MYLVVERRISGFIHKPVFRVETGAVSEVYARCETFREASQEMAKLADRTFGRGRSDFWNEEQGCYSATYGTPRAGGGALYLEVVEESAVELPVWCRKQLTKLAS